MGYARIAVSHSETASMGKRRITWKRVVAIVILTWVGLWLLSLPIGHVMAWYEAKQIAGEDRNTALLPQPLPDMRVADLRDGMTISRFGYNIRVPWTKAQAGRDFKTIAYTSFDDGSSLLIINPAEHMDLLSGVPGQKLDAVEGLRPLLGDEAVRSHYDYEKAVLNAQPSEISLFHSTKRNVRVNLLLAMKGIQIRDGVSAIYSVAGGSVRGFQFGDPQKLPTSIRLLLFDDHDRALELVLRGPKTGNRPAVTQEQINAIIASITIPDRGCMTPGHCG